MGGDGKARKYIKRVRKGKREKQKILKDSRNLADSTGMYRL